MWTKIARTRPPGRSTVLVLAAAAAAVAALMTALEMRQHDGATGEGTSTPRADAPALADDPRTARIQRTSACADAQACGATMKPLPVSVTTRLVRGVVDAHAPLTALLDPRADVTRSLQSAWENEVAECMRERGLDYTPRPADEADDADPNGAMLAAMTPAERKGWDAALLGRVSEGDHEEDDSRVALDVTEHVSMAWSGDACAARADRALYGDDGLYRNLHMQLTLMREEAQARADHDPDYAEGLKVYAGCMRARGKSVPEAILDGEDTLDEAHEGPEAECQQTARLFERRRLAVASAEQDLAERNQHDLIAFQELQDEALEASETN